MPQITEFQTLSGEKVFVEITMSPDVRPLAADGSDIISKASQTFESALASVQRTVALLADSLGRIGTPADTVEMELGIKASSKVGFYLASADGEAQIKIKLVWKRAAGESGDTTPTSTT